MKYRELYHLPDDPLKEPPSKPLRTPFEAPSDPLRSQDQDQDQDQDQEQKKHIYPPRAHKDGQEQPQGAGTQQQPAVPPPLPQFTTPEVRDAWLSATGGIDVDTESIRLLVDRLNQTANEPRSIAPILSSGGGKLVEIRELPVMAIAAYMRCYRSRSRGFEGNGPSPLNMLKAMPRVLLILANQADPEADAKAREQEAQEKRERAAAAEKARREGRGPPPKQPERPKPQLLTNEMLLGGPEKVAQLKREREENLRRKQEQAAAAAGSVPPAKVLP